MDTQNLLATTVAVSCLLLILLVRFGFVSREEMWVSLKISSREEMWVSLKRVLLKEWSIKASQTNQAVIDALCGGQHDADQCAAPWPALQTQETLARHTKDVICTNRIFIY